MSRLFDLGLDSSFVLGIGLFLRDVGLGALLPLLYHGYPSWLRGGGGVIRLSANRLS